MFSLLWIATVAATNPATTTATASIHGSIEASLVRVVSHDGPALAAQVARLLRWRGDIVRNVQPRDRIAIVYDPNSEPTAQLIALDYAGSEITLRAYRFEDREGIARYFDQFGVLVEPGMKNAPAPGYFQITETPQSGSGKRRHKGIDFKAPEGTPVLLPFDARVRRVNWLTRVNGRCIEVLYDDGKLARFLHLLEVEPLVLAGAKLTAGTRIGAVGSTGRSSAPHLHYEVRTRSGGVVDPLRFHGTTRVEVSPAQHNGFAAARKKLDALLKRGGESHADAR